MSDFLKPDADGGFTITVKHPERRIDAFLDEATGEMSLVENGQTILSTRDPDEFIAKKDALAGGTMVVFHGWKLVPGPT